MMVCEPSAEVDRRGEIEPVWRLVVDRLDELLQAAGELGRFEVRGGEILAERLQRAVRIRRRTCRGRDVTLEVIDDEAEPIAERTQWLGHLSRHFDRDIACNFLLLHKLPVSKNQVSSIP